VTDLAERLRDSEAYTIWNIVGEAADEIERLQGAIRRLLEHRVGALPRQGWLNDNDASRRCLEDLAALVAEERRGGQ
jgi:hypothetical protein